MSTFSAWLPSGNSVEITSNGRDALNVDEVRENLSASLDTYPSCVQVIDIATGALLIGSSVINGDVQIVLLDETSHLEASFLNAACVTSMEDLVQTVSVNVEDKGLYALPDSIKLLSSAEALKVNQNVLRTLPGTLLDLRRLTSLELSNNSFSGFPEIICDLTGLKTLHLNYNQIVSLPDSIGQLQELEDLQLSHNQLEAVPNSICDLSLLRYLFLSDNNLVSIPSALYRLVRLQHLRLEGNQLSNFQQMKIMPLVWGQMLTARRVGRISTIPDSPR